MFMLLLYLEYTITINQSSYCVKKYITIKSKRYDTCLSKTFSAKPKPQRGNLQPFPGFKDECGDNGEAKMFSSL